MGITFGRDHSVNLQSSTPIPVVPIDVEAGTSPSNTVHSAQLAVAAPDQPSDTPQNCSAAQPVAAVAVYTLFDKDDAQWCGTWCMPENLVQCIEQFGTVVNGTCVGAGWAASDFDHIE